MDSYPIGATVLLNETYTINGTLTDPDTVTLLTQDPTGAQQTYTYAGSTITRLSTGAYQKSFAPAITGIWSYKWTGTGAGPAVGEGQFEVYDLLGGDSTATPTGNLVSVNAYKTAFGLSNSDSSQDANIRFWIGAASSAIMAYTRREFSSTLGTGTRAFEIRSTGYVPFGKYDLQSATLVQIDTAPGDDTSSPTTINPDQYLMMPVTQPDGVYTALRFYTFAVGPILRQVYGVSRVASITGTWGWPSVPADVQRACLLCAHDWIQGYAQGFSETLAPRLQEEIGAAITGNLPSSARMLLDPYRKVQV